MCQTKKSSVTLSGEGLGKPSIFGSALVLTAVLVFMAGCPTDADPFVAVMDITGVPATGATGTVVDLAVATVAPADATNKTIVWSVKTAGAGVNSVSGASFTPPSAGGLVLTATIADGKAEGTAFTKDFTITIGAFVPVTGITGVPSGGTAGTQVDLTVAEVAPTNASFKTIVWTVNNAGTTGVGNANIVNGKFTPASAGELELVATIANGLAATGAPYTRTFYISIAASGAFVPVSNITGVPTGGTVDTVVSLAGMTVEPSNANHKDIDWSVKTSGAGVTSITGTSFTPTSAGTVVLTATIANGKAEGTAFTKEFRIDISAQGAFVAVTNITGVPTTGTAGTPVTLTNATVVPNTATYQDIVWEVKDAGGTGVTTAMLRAGSFTPPNAGTLELTAKILSGAAVNTLYTQDFDITIAPAFVAVTGITGLNSTINGVTGAQIDLTTAKATPDDATNTTIVWSVKNAGTTGLASADVATGIFTPTNAGTVTLIATITNGVEQGKDFIKEDYTITIIKPVTNITGVPTTGTKGFEVSLSDATVEPTDATYKDIVWSVKTAGTTGVTNASIVNGKFTPASAGDLELTATIANGQSIGTAYTKEFTITISNPGTFSPGFGLGDDTSIKLTGTTSGSSPQNLSKDTPATVAKGATYYVSIVGTGYSNIAWYLNGTKQTVPDALIYLDTSSARTIKLSVAGTKDGVLESSGTYTFVITE